MEEFGRSMFIVTPYYAGLSALGLGFGLGFDVGYISSRLRLRLDAMHTCQNHSPSS